MIVIPAIDILGGKVVRLKQGDYGKVTVYADNPRDIAASFKDRGARHLHIVDLDGARSGKPVNITAVQDIVNDVGIDVEVGGGIRNGEAIETVLGIGAKQVVLGTAALTDRAFAAECISRYGEAVVVGVDVRNDKLAVRGWTDEGQSPVGDCIRYFESVGLQRIIYTDVTKDGMMEGPNLAGIERLLKLTKMEIIVSGGVSTIDDIRRVKRYEGQGVKGVIIGKAIYEGTIDLKEALDAG